MNEQFINSLYDAGVDSVRAEHYEQKYKETLEQRNELAEHIIKTDRNPHFKREAEYADTGYKAKEYIND